LDVVFVTGTAGSGKSLLTRSLRDWYVSRGEDAVTVNLDPGVENLPYEPDVDIRKMIDFRDVMETYGLGPNGALILTADMVAARLGEVQGELDEYRAEHVVVDTPGQTELFSFRESGPYIVREMKADSKVLLFLMDPVLANTPVNFLSLVLLSASVGMRMNVPRISVLTKRDMDRQAIRRIMEWSTDSSVFEEALSKAAEREGYSFYSELFRTLRRQSIGAAIYPVSSVDLEGFVALVGEITRICRGGEEVTD
jgi:GTPase SAR1 family protein